MKKIREITENEMILAFIKGEIKSTASSAWYQDQPDFKEELISNADLNNPEQNKIRKRILITARYHLFQSLPNDINWVEMSINAEEMGKFKYLDHESWIKFSNGTRLVSDGVSNIEKFKDERTKQIGEIAVGILKGIEMSPLILLAINDDLIIIEGNKRATAYVYTKYDKPLKAIVGYSNNMDKWAYA